MPNLKTIIGPKIQRELCNDKELIEKFKIGPFKGYLIQIFSSDKGLDSTWAHYEVYFTKNNELIYVEIHIEKEKGMGKRPQIQKLLESEPSFEEKLEWGVRNDDVFYIRLKNNRIKTLGNNIEAISTAITEQVVDLQNIVEGKIKTVINNNILD